MLTTAIDRTLQTNKEPESGAQRELLAHAYLQMTRAHEGNRPLQQTFAEKAIALGPNHNGFRKTLGVTYGVEWRSGVKKLRKTRKK